MLETLKRARVFKECTAQEVQAIVNVSERLTLKEEEYVFEAGSTADTVYLVIDGVIDLRFTVSHYLADKQVPIDRILKNEIFGWSALMASKPYTLSALAARDTDLLRMPAKEIRTLCSENHHFGYVLMKNIGEIIGERFQLVQQMLIDVIQQQLDEKERRM